MLSSIYYAVSDVLAFVYQTLPPWPGLLFARYRQANLFGSRRRLTAAERKRDGGAITFSLMQYNLNNVAVRCESRRGRVLHAIRTSNADVCLLQETNEEWQRCLRQLTGGKYGYEFFHHPGVHDRAAGGLAILSRYKMENIELVDIVKAVDGSVFPAVRCDVSVPTADGVQVLHIANIHLRPPVNLDGSAWLETARLTEPIRIGEVKFLLRSSDGSPPDIIAGDFNEGDSAGAIAHLRRLGYRDALAAFVPKHKETHTWPFWKLTLRKRLDHVLWTSSRSITTSGGATAKLKCCGCGVLTGYVDASDHQPVLSNFMLDFEDGKVRREEG